MKFPLAIVVLIALDAGASAKPSPFAPPSLPRPAAASDANAIYFGRSGSTPEADYFRTPEPRYGAGRVFPCRAHLQAVEITRRIVQACD